MKKIMVFGTFDGLHEGHLDFFRQARKFGDYLIAVVARDKNVGKLKNRLPRSSEKVRLKEVQSLNFVNKAMLGGLKDPFKIIHKIKPDIICLGYDQNSYVNGLDGLGLKIVRLKAYKPKKYHSSLINK